MFGPAPGQQLQKGTSFPTINDVAWSNSTLVKRACLENLWWGNVISTFGGEKGAQPPTPSGSVPADRDTQRTIASF